MDNYVEPCPSDSLPLPSKHLMKIYEPGVTSPFAFQSVYFQLLEQQFIPEVIELLQSRPFPRLDHVFVKLTDTNNADNTGFVIYLSSLHYVIKFFSNDLFFKLLLNYDDAFDVNLLLRYDLDLYACYLPDDTCFYNIVKLLVENGIDLEIMLVLIIKNIMMYLAKEANKIDEYVLQAKLRSVELLVRQDIDLHLERLQIKSLKEHFNLTLIENDKVQETLVYLIKLFK